MASFGQVVFARRGSRLVTLALGALALMFAVIVAVLLVNPPSTNRSPTTTAAWLALCGVLVAASAWRSGARGLFFYQRGFRVSGFFGSRSWAYADISGVTAEDVIFEYRGRHHTVVIRFDAGGTPERLTLPGHVGFSLAETRDPDADGIVDLMRGGRGSARAAEVFAAPRSR